MISKGDFAQLKKELQLSPAQKRFLFFVLLGIIGWIIILQLDFVQKYFTYLVTKGAAISIGLFTGKTPLIVDLSHQLNFRLIDDRGHILIGDACNGFDLYYVFVLFILAFPTTRVKLKWVYSLLGVFIMFIANVIRVDALFFIAKSHPDWFELVHKVIFQVAVYIIMFLLWAVYLRMISNTSREK